MSTGVIECPSATPFVKDLIGGDTKCPRADFKEFDIAPSMLLLCGSIGVPVFPVMLDIELGVVSRRWFISISPSSPNDADLFTNKGVWNSESAVGIGTKHLQH